MLSQPLTGGMGGVGEVFRTNLKVPGTTRPLKFLRTVIFLKIKRDGNEKFLWQDHPNRQPTLMS